MKETETVNQFMTRVSSIVTQLQTYGKDLEHKVFSQNILRYLTKKFDMFVTSMKEDKDFS